MANFSLIFPSILKYEGFYVNDPADAGGETYAGVSRVFNPNWKGWQIIDKYKADHGTIPYNTKIQSTELDQLVYSKALEYFNKIKGSEINSTAVATIAAQVFWGSGANGIKKVIQQAAINLGAKIDPDGDVGTETIKALNSLSQLALYNETKKLYIAFINNLGTAQPKYATGWKNRLNYVLSLTDKFVTSYSFPIFGVFLGSFFIYLAMKK